jgi:hypothetical protein
MNEPKYLNPEPKPVTPVDVRLVMRDKRGKYRTKSLFHEFNPNDEKYKAFFTMGEIPKKGYVNMREKYLEIGDPTEYKVAIELLGSFEHWQALQRVQWFKKELLKWRKELEMHILSESVSRMRKASKGTDGTAVAASKWLANKPWAEIPQERGKKSKKQIEGLQQQTSEDLLEVEEDGNRLFGDDDSTAK